MTPSWSKNGLLSAASFVFRNHRADFATLYLLLCATTSSSRIPRAGGSYIPGKGEMNDILWDRKLNQKLFSSLQFRFYIFSMFDFDEFLSEWTTEQYCHRILHSRVDERVQQIFIVIFKTMKQNFKYAVLFIITCSFLNKICWIVTPKK